MSEQRTQHGLSVKTLLIAGSASAVAAIVIPMLWRPGTVFAAAMTPVIVAVVTEVLKRPVDTVSAVATRPVRRTTDVLDRDDDPFDPLAPPSAEELEALPQATRTTSALHRRKPLTGRQWKLALATGLTAFAAVAVLFTVTELVAGGSVSTPSRTTFFSGGSSKHKGDATPTPEATPSATPDKSEREEDPEATPTPTPTPSATETPAPAATATPAPTVQSAPQATPPPDATPVP